MTIRSAFVLAIVLASCQGPEDWSPAAEHRRESAQRAAALATHLETLPGIAHASVILDEPVADPLAPPAPAAPPRASIVLALAPGAHADTATADARRAVTAALPALDDAHLSIIAAPAPAAPRKPDRLLVPLAIALAVIIGLAGWIAVIQLRHRRGMIPQ